MVIEKLQAAKDFTTTEQALVTDEELNSEYILPAAFDPRVKDAVAKAVSEAARASGVARI